MGGMHRMAPDTCLARGAARREKERSVGVFATVWATGSGRYAVIVPFFALPRASGDKPERKRVRAACATR